MNLVGEDDGGKDNQNIEAGNAGAEEQGHALSQALLPEVLPEPLLEPLRSPLRTLPAPFHIRGRRPSAGARTMESIVEE